MHWLCLGKPDWDQHPEHIADAAKHKPIGIAPHGALNERLHRQKKYDVLTDLLKRIRDQGVLVGLSAHDPTLIEVAEEQGWDVDYYMCCLYYLTRPKEEYQEDPRRRTCRWARSTCPPTRRGCSRPSRRRRSRAWSTRCWRPAGGSAARPRCGSASRRRSPNIKPTDAVIVGMYQQFGDQVGENASTVRSIASTG